MKNRHILIIEDESLTALRIQDILSKEGYSYTTIVDNAEDADCAIRSGNIDLILADIHIKGAENGIEFAERMIVSRSIPIVFISAQNDEKTFKSVAAFKDCFFIPKPFMAHNIITNVQLALIKSESTDIALADCCSYNRAKHTIKLEEEKEYILTPKEALLLNTLLYYRGSICPMEVIEQNVWPDEAPTDGTRRTLLYKLKNNLPCLQIETHRGVGIKLH